METHGLLTDLSMAEDLFDLGVVGWPPEPHPVLALKADPQPAVGRFIGAPRFATFCHVLMARYFKGVRMANFRRAAAD